MQLNILVHVALWISIFSSLQISSVKFFLQPPSDFYSTGPENITVISSRPKNAPYYKKSKIKLQKKKKKLDYVLRVCRAW